MEERIRRLEFLAATLTPGEAQTITETVAFLKQNEVTFQRCRNALKGALRALRLIKYDVERVHDELTNHLHCFETGAF